MTEHALSCGCRFRVLSPPLSPGGAPLLDLDLDELNEDCPLTWDMLGRGLTKGVFQLESRLGMNWARKLKPTSIDHMGALGALLRPGPLNAKDENGVSLTEHYALRKNGEEPVQDFHPALEPILRSTYGVLCYQEQSLRIAKEIAGFDPVAADRLRKGTGKKDMKLISSIEVEFKDGCKKTGVIDEHTACVVWDWIRSTGRYQFNSSHSMCYGIRGFKTAYLKAHFPPLFFAAWLRNARLNSDPRQEIYELVNEAKLFGVAVEPPDQCRSPSAGVWTDGERVRFGFADVKGVGKGVAEKLAGAMGGLPLSGMSWWQLLQTLFGMTTQNVMTRLVLAGAFRHTGLPRKRQLAEYEALRSLTEKEREWVGEREFGGLEQALAALSRPRYRRPKRKSDPEPQGPFGGCSSEQRERAVASQLALLRSPPSPLVDTPAWLARQEEDLLGIALTCWATDSCDVSSVNATCKEVRAGRAGRVVLAVTVEEVRPTKTKSGRAPGSPMGRATLSDGTANLEAVVFPDEWASLSPLFSEGNTLVVVGERENNGYDSLIVKKASQAGRLAV